MNRFFTSWLWWQLDQTIGVSHFSTAYPELLLPSAKDINDIQYINDISILALRKLATAGCCRPRVVFLFSLIYSWQTVALRLVLFVRKKNPTKQTQTLWLVSHGKKKNKKTQHPPPHPPPTWKNSSTCYFPNIYILSVKKLGGGRGGEALAMQNKTPKLFHTVILIFVCISFIHELQSLLKHFLGLFRQKSPQEEKWTVSS